MAIVQLVDLSVASKQVSEFRYFKSATEPLSEGRRSITGLDGLKSLILGSSISGFQSHHWGVSKSDWPKGSSHFASWDTGFPVRIVFVISWNDNEIAGEYMQPEEKFWVIHPSNGRIVAVNSDVSLLKEEVRGFLGGSSIF